VAVLLAQHHEHRGPDVSAPHAPTPATASATGTPAEPAAATPATGEVPAVAFVTVVTMPAFVPLRAEPAISLAACPAAFVCFEHLHLLHVVTFRVPSRYIATYRDRKDSPS
jgi:hypothetical protein